MRIRDYPEVSRAGPVSSGRWGVRAAVAQRPVWVRAELAVVVAYRGWEGSQLRHARYVDLHRAARRSRTRRTGSV